MVSFFTRIILKGHVCIKIVLKTTPWAVIMTQLKERLLCPVMRGWGSKACFKLRLCFVHTALNEFSISWKFVRLATLFPRLFPSHFLTKKILETGLVRFGVPFTRKHFNRTIIKFRANRTKILNGSVWTKWTVKFFTRSKIRPVPYGRILRAMICRADFIIQMRLRTRKLRTKLLRFSPRVWSIRGPLEASIKFAPPFFIENVHNLNSEREQARTPEPK